jgi:hypothetical protein
MVQSMFLYIIVFCPYHSTPEGAAVVYINISVIFFQSYIIRAWGMPASFVHSSILLRTLWKVGLYRFLSSPTDYSTRSHSRSPLQHSVKETLMDFSYTYAPNLIHQGASVITEISSAHGDKNSASSKQD